MSFNRFRLPSPPYSILAPTLIISMIIIFPAIQQWAIDKHIPVLKDMKLVATDPSIHEFFMSNFIQAFGVLYGVLLPLILTKTIDNYSSLYREFELEADITRILYENMLLLPPDYRDQTQIVWLLRKYISHVIQNNQREAQEPSMIKIKGDEILSNIRKQVIQVTSGNENKITQSSNLGSELRQKLSELERTRMNRIVYSRQLFSGIGYEAISVLSATIFLAPFFINAFWKDTGFTEEFLVIALTFVVVLLNSVIEDLAKPFDGIWKIRNVAWERLLKKNGIIRMTW